MEINILSYLNFFFPNGQLDDSEDNAKWEEIYNTYQHMDDEQ